MQEKIRLLMEETNCEQGEAELALELAGDDLEKAIRTIESLLRHISAFKGKFCFPSKNLYGLFIMIVDTKTEVILRSSIVVSYNPAVYENTLETDWYSFEKLIFSCRLDEGALPDFTQNIEQKLQSYLLLQKDMFGKCDTERLSTLFRDFFAPEQVALTIVAEEMNLAQFRQMPDGDAIPESRSLMQVSEAGTVRLEVELIEEKSGKEAGKLAEGEVVLSQITDTRDIAHYLAHLIGGKREGSMIPLPSMVRTVAVNGETAEVQVHYAPGIIGVATIDAGFRVKVLETRTQPWWRKIIPWT